MPLWVVVGGQFGSEGKGKISAVITLQEDIDICVRCGGPNSGHSFQWRSDDWVIMRQLPTGFISPRTRLLVPAGALVDLEVLRREIELFRLDPKRVGVDRAAMIIARRDQERERRLHLGERLSSTLSGVGAALARRILRLGNVELARDVTGRAPWLAPLLTDVAAEVNEALDMGRKVLIEGTQGYGLSVYHSPFYPKATSRDTTAASFLSEVGVSPTRVTEIVLVFRTFPIRVAGAQAGPLREEVTWEQIAREAGWPVPLEERTTVTGRIRRVGRFDWELARRAITLNRPTRIALNFLDYLDFTNRGASTWDALTAKARDFVLRVEAEFGVPVWWLGTGPHLSQTLLRNGNGAGEAWTAELVATAKHAGRF